MSIDSLDVKQRRWSPVQYGLQEFDDTEDVTTHSLDCQDCVRFVHATGPTDHAIYCAQVHIEERLACREVLITDEETGVDLAIVSENGVERFDEGDHDCNA